MNQGRVMKRSRRRRGEIRGIITRTDQFRVKGWWRLLRFVVIRVCFLLALFYIVAGFPIQNGRRNYESARDACLLFIPLTAAYLGPCRNPRISLNETIFYIGDNLVLGTFFVSRKPPESRPDGVSRALLRTVCHARDGPPPCIAFTG